MRNIPDILKEQIVNEKLYRKNHSGEVMANNSVYKKLATEGSDIFFDYVDWLGLANDQGFIVLPPSHHYYYDAEELKDVKTVVNLKQLNHIKQIKEFLHNIFSILPSQSYFLGTFTDRKFQNSFFSYLTINQTGAKGQVDAVENGIESRIPFLNMMYNILDSKTNRNLSKRSVTLLLEDTGFKVLNMSELNGLTYFCAQKVRRSPE
jgi:hypothetical protein